jgi:hypothetical protein
MLADERSWGAEADLPLVFADDFEHGDSHWQPTDANGWKIKAAKEGHVYSQFKKDSNYKPPHRSPLNISLLKDVVVGDFVLTAKVLSTHPDYAHRDACLVFGYQDPAHFYYVHFGKKTDDHANQIFIVNDAPRTKISTKTSVGTDWDDSWHNIKIVRKTNDGTIEIYYDDMKNPVMTAKNNAFDWGRIGIGSFDDTTDWDDIHLHGIKVTKP